MLQAQCRAGLMVKNKKEEATLSLIQINHSPDDSTLASITKSWPIWSCEVSDFPWTYDSRETCYLLEGEVVITPDAGQPVTIKAGDLVAFPAGLSCRWNVLKAVRKHYQFDNKGAC